MSNALRLLAGLPPEGYRVEETNEKVQVMATRLLRSRAESYARQYPPTIPSYRLQVEKVGFLRYEIVAYQNRLQKI